MYTNGIQMYTNGIQMHTNGIRYSEFRHPSMGYGDRIHSKRTDLPLITLSGTRAPESTCTLACKPSEACFSIASRTSWPLERKGMERRSASSRDCRTTCGLRSVTVVMVWFVLVACHLQCATATQCLFQLSAPYNLAYEMLRVVRTEHNDFRSCRACVTITRRSLTGSQRPVSSRRP